MTGIVDLVRYVMLIEEYNKLAFTSTGQGDVVFGFFTEVDNARFLEYALVHRLCTIEFRIAESCQTPDSIGGCRGESVFFDKEHICLRNGDGCREIFPVEGRFGSRRPRFFATGFTFCECEWAEWPVLGLINNSLHMVGRYWLDRGEEFPLVLICLEVFVDKNTVALPLCKTLEGERNQIAKTAFSNTRLRRKKAIVRVKAGRTGSNHSVGDESAAKVSGERCIDWFRKEYPCVTTVAGTGSLDGYFNMSFFACALIRSNFHLPTCFVEISNKNGCLAIFVEHVQANNVFKISSCSFEVCDECGVVDRNERTIGAVRAAGAWVAFLGADAWLPFVFASRRVADSAVFATIPMSVDILSALKQLAKEGKLVLSRACRGNDTPELSLMCELAASVEPLCFGRIEPGSRGVRVHNNWLAVPTMSDTLSKCNLMPMHKRIFCKLIMCHGESFHTDELIVLRNN